MEAISEKEKEEMKGKVVWEDIEYQVSKEESIPNRVLTFYPKKAPKVLRRGRNCMELLKNGSRCQRLVWRDEPCGRHKEKRYIGKVKKQKPPEWYNPSCRYCNSEIRNICWLNGECGSR